MVGKELSQLATKTSFIGYRMAFINDDDVPAGLFQPGTELTVILQRIDRDNGLVVVVERILVHRNVHADMIHAGTVETHQWDGEAIPQFFLELGKNTFQSTYKDTAASSSAYHFAEEDSHLYGLSQTYAICNE